MLKAYCTTGCVETKRQELEAKRSVEQRRHRKVVVKEIEKFVSVHTDYCPDCGGTLFWQSEKQPLPRWVSLPDDDEWIYF
jgi:hypothetical protein